MTPAERRAVHQICGTTQLMDEGYEAATTALEQAFALLTVMQLAATDTGNEFGLLNMQIHDRAFHGIQYLIAEAHFHLSETRQQS